MSNTLLVPLEAETDAYEVVAYDVWVTGVEEYWEVGTDEAYRGVDVVAPRA